MKKNSQIRAKIIELREKIEKWNHHYYQLQNPLVDDLVYDKTLRELEKLERENFFLFSLEELNQSPSQKVGSKITSKFEKVAHSSPMLSLNKAYSNEELEKWAKKAREILKTVTFFVEPKIDGIALSLFYQNGNLIKALTRGDGVFGENVLVNALKINDEFIPKKINYLEDLEVRGEIYIDNSTFASLQLETKKFKNPRNAASGILRRYKNHKPKIDAKSIKFLEEESDFRYLKSFFYTLVNPEKHKINSQFDSINFLRNLGFQVNPFQKKCSDLKDVFNFISIIKQKRDFLNYNIDGVVVKVNEFSIYEKLGSTSKFPHSAIAFKFEDDIAKTKLLAIFATIGRTGKVTYNAKIEPVTLAGSKISSAILPNYSYIENLKLNLNTEVYIKKAGEIIPQIIGSVHNYPKTNFSIVKNCPKCNSELVNSESGLDQFCQNQFCPEIILQKIVHFCSKNALNIESLAQKRIEKFLEKGLISSACDIFYLKDKLELIYERLSNKNQLLTKQNASQSMQIKSIMKLLNEIERAKNIDFYRLIFGLGIRNVGLKAAKILSRYASNLSELRNLDFNLLKNQHDFGPVIIESLIDYFNNQKNSEQLNCLVTVGFNFKTTFLTNQSNSWASFAISGKLSKPRDEYVRIIEESGASFHESVTKKTDFLLLGQSAGSKIEKAKKAGIKIINEVQFFDLIKNSKKT